MVSPVFVASLVTVVPAMAAVWYFLKRYEGMFEDARVFFSLTVGFFAGLATAAFEFYTDFADPALVAASPGLALTFFLVGYPFFEAGIKTMVLGLRRFRGRKDTPYYGTSLGLGFGAMLGLMLLSTSLATGEALGTPYGTAGFAMLTLLIVGVVLAHGATGVWVGKGAAEGKLWKGWGYGALFQLPVQGALWLYWPNLGRGDLPWYASAVPAVFAAFYGAALLVITQKQVLDHVVPAEILAKVRREKRRAMRQAALGTTAVDDSEE